MSANLVQLADAHRAPGGPTVVELLSAAVRERGALADDDIRAAAAATGLPEAAVHGVATFYDDLLAPRGRPPRPRLHRHRLLRGDGRRPRWRRSPTAWASARRPRSDGSVSLAETVCLGFCHSAPAVRDGDVVDGGAGVVERVVAGTTRRGARAGERAACSTSRS